MPTKQIMKKRAGEILYRELEFLFSYSGNYHNFEKQKEKVLNMAYIIYHTGLLNESAYVEILRYCGIYFKKGNGDNAITDYSR